MKNFVKALAKKPENTALKYLKTKFPRLLTEKIKAGVFVGPQIKKLFTDTEFQQCLDSSEAKAWKAFQKVVHGFLRNNRSNNDRQLKYFKTTGARMSLKMHLLHSHLDFFPPNLGAESDEQCERFHQDIATIDDDCDNCWMQLREDSVQHKRRSLRVKAYFRPQT
ncbi:uncharacterized protein LOC128869635 [Anastrepha ludens]|uniref:uncharacterized protein LOC128869635 n=1 Tax=Anastrepha ludens TaxID=28586 RepID=UPI0023B10AA3|nr:uncharacterized protein LOC128869635 [Anastrepha ludens]